MPCSKCTCALARAQAPDVQLPPIKMEVARLLPYSQTIDWGYKYLQASQFQQQTQGGKDAIVFILDTGIADHEDLNENRLTQYDRNFTSDTEIVHPHGTHCAGIVAAVNNQIGILGIAPNAKLVDVQVLDGQGAGGYGRITDGIKYVTSLELAEEHRHMKKIISMSLGGSGANDNMYQAIKDAIASGVYVVAAAGNSGYTEGENTIGYPGRYPEVITVASLKPDDNNDPSDQQTAGYSSAGPEIDVAAPGSDVLSTVLDNGYAKFSGTSMACPQVAGLCALLVTAKKGLGGQDEMEKLLRNHALDLMAQGFDIHTGFGAPVITNYLNNGEPEPEPGQPEPPKGPPDFRSQRVNLPVVVKNVIHWKRGTDSYQAVDVRLRVNWVTNREYTQVADLISVATDQYFKDAKYSFKGENYDLYNVYQILKRRVVRFLKDAFGQTEIIRVTKITLTDDQGHIFER